MAKYPINQTARDSHLRINVEKGIKDFVNDYATDLGTSVSSAARRLILIGARCEAEHGHSPMPAAYDKLVGKKPDEADLEPDFFLGEDWR